MPKQMYPGKINSPQTELAADITATDTTITVQDASALPDAHNLITIGSDENAETILYRGKNGNDLTDCIRGFQGAARAWPAGSKCARNYTAYDHDAARENIEENRAAAQTAQQTADSANTAITNHVNDKTNPHGVTKAQVGLSNVDNAKQATKTEFDAHVNNKSNPHGVTPAQIGLGNVDNVKQATKAEFDAHVNNKSNPHGVTAAQVGALPKNGSEPMTGPLTLPYGSQLKVLDSNGNRQNVINLLNGNAIQIGNGVFPVILTSSISLPYGSQIKFNDINNISRNVINLYNGNTIQIGSSAFQKVINWQGDEFWDILNNPASLAQNGYQKLASGLILQWGVSTPPTPGNYNVTYPIAFPNRPLFANASPLMDAGESASATVTELTTTGFGVTFTYSGQQGLGRGYTWLAIGY